MADPGPVRRRIVVEGRVHGVGFRASCAGIARRLDLQGWVRNRPDGTVEVLAAGSAQAVEELTQWCRHGPPTARVLRVMVADALDTERIGDGFELR